MTVTFLVLHGVISLPCTISCEIIFRLRKDVHGTLMHEICSMYSFLKLTKSVHAHEMIIFGIYIFQFLDDDIIFYF